MSKESVAIVVDSTANLPAELVAQHHLHVVPQILNWGGQSLRDGIDITTSSFYQRLASDKDIPTTSQPSPGQFLAFFQEVAQSAESIVGIFISEYLSGTLASALAAAKMMEDYPIEIVDSRSASLGLGLIALAAAEAVADGKDYRAVAETARAIVPRMRVLFVVDTLEYLHRGGRIGGAKRLVGSMLSIKPVLHLEDGRIEALASVRTKRKAVQHMLDVVTADAGSEPGCRVGLLHAATPAEAEMVVAEVRRRIHPSILIQSELTPVIGTHVGPGTVGLAYYRPV